MLRFNDELDSIQFALEKPAELDRRLNADIKLSHLTPKEREYVIEMNRNLTLLKIIFARIRSSTEIKEKLDYINKLEKYKEEDYLREINLIAITGVNKVENHALNLLFGHFHKEQQEEEEEDIVKKLFKKKRKQREEDKEDED